MAAFINTPLRKIKSDSFLLNKIAPIRISRSDTNLLHMSMLPISPKSIKKEIIYGSVMAAASVFLQGQHHHIPTFTDIYNSLTFESIDTMRSLYENDKSKLNKMLRLRKINLFILALVLPYFIRFFMFLILEFIL